MFKNGYDGRLFEFENTYFDNPKVMEFIRVWQIGELSAEPGFEMVKHIQACHEISYIVSGTGVFCADGQATPVKEGDIHVVPQGKTHQILANDSQNLRFAYIGFEFTDVHNRDDVQKMEKLFCAPPTYLLHDSGAVRLLVYMLISEMYGKPVYNSIMVESYVKQILVQIYRLFESVKTDIFVPDITKNIIGHSVYSIVRYIDSCIYEIGSIREIAQKLGYSHSYLSHLFKSKMGITLQAYVLQKKIEASLDLLIYQKTPIHQIAATMGYESVQSYSKAFKRQMGCTPTEYLSSSESVREEKV
jgi:AraC-like DNA-binding protein/mannose-6-phosphate isomerase-like protein (cupin superfamily)